MIAQTSLAEAYNDILLFGRCQEKVIIQEMMKSRI